MNNINANVDNLLAQMRILAAQAEARPAEATPAPKGANFSQLLSQSIEGVNASQQHAGQLAEAFETGAADVSLPEVMVALQKANLSFQAMTTVRNKLVAAYQEVMGMQM